MHHQGAVGAYKLGKVCEPFEVALLVAVYVEMVGIGGCDYRYVGCEMVERSVEFIRLHH